MECRLCLCSVPPVVLVSIYDDPHLPHLVQRIWTCCRLRVRKGDDLPDTICLSCVNNLELLNSFRNACVQSNETSRVGSAEALDVKAEEVLLKDFMWENELGADLPPNISSSPDDGEIPRVKITSDNSRSEMIDADELPLPKTSSTHSELGHKINSQDKSFTLEHNLVKQKRCDSQRKPHSRDKPFKSMECRLCLCSAPPEAFVSIHDDPHPRRLSQRIWTCCKLQVREDDCLPDMICLSCVYNLELLESFRNHSLRSDKVSRMKSDTSLDVKSEEALLEDLIWDVESGANFPPNISSSPDDGETRGGEINLNDNLAELMDTNKHILAEELPLRKALDKMCSTDSELDHKIHFQDKSSTHKHNLVTLKTSDTRGKLYDCDICAKSFTTKENLDAHKSIHTGVKPHKCNIRLKSFALQLQPGKHLSHHSGEKPPKCDICSKSLNTKQNLGTHTRVRQPKCANTSESSESNTTVGHVARNRPTKYNNASSDTKMILIKCFKDGKTIKESAEIAGINKNTAKGIINRYKKNGDMLEEKCRGGRRNIKLSSELLIEIENIVVENPSITLKKIKEKILERKSVHLSIGSIFNALEKR
ncbi:uncharacterized protein LOC143913497 [Arctopsyche grandis]|uniref:uncharacterized protein LOC143913497 n=1 Tax=Arctopsyche grandis TaxID=121162 RepID=UPI00406D8901